MTELLKKITLGEWDSRYEELRCGGLVEPFFGGPLRRHVHDGDLRLQNLLYDDSPAALNLWNFLLTEEDRLHGARKQGKKIVGTMKDLGTVPVIAYALSDFVAFYPDGAWWTPCIMEHSDGLFAIADSLGIDESFCPVRAMIAAFVAGSRFPIPDLLISSTGAVCDDFSAIAQRLASLGHPIIWWEIPHRRQPHNSEESVTLPGGFECPGIMVDIVAAELMRVKAQIESLASGPITDEMLASSIEETNAVRSCLAELRRLVYTSPRSPLPALEMLIAEMLAIHFCSDRPHCLKVLRDLVSLARGRIEKGRGYARPDAARIFWVNPVADLRAMNVLESCNARICGTDYLFTHALDPIPQNIPPIEALAQMALADPMVGPSSDRARRICRDISLFGAEALVISRIPGASHCAAEGSAIAEIVGSTCQIPVLEIEIPSLSDSMRPALRNRIEALVEVVIHRRKM
jgi:benzoyl-CoA reductase/2-hydroxyglutaryl-CoA dehydratase subunit BcrC/BadD/HgdB